MKVKVIEEPLGLVVVLDEMLHAVDRRLSVIAHQVISVEVIALGVKSV